MDTRFIVAVSLCGSVCAVAGCIPPCPAPDAESPTVTEVSGQIVSEGVSAGPYTYVVSRDYVDGQECRVEPTFAGADAGDVETQSRPWLRFRCPTSMVPMLEVRLPDLRATEVSADPIVFPVDVTQNTEFGSPGGCAAQWFDVPAEVTVLEAAGGAAAEHPFVTPDFDREALLRVVFDPGAQPGVDLAGEPCASDVPPFAVDLSVRLTADDFGRPGGGCG